MPKLRSKTFTNENDLRSFMETSKIPATFPDYFGNSSGHISIFFNDPAQDRMVEVFATDTASEASFADAVAAGDFTERINIANASRLLVEVEVVQPSTDDLYIDVRISNKGDPEVTTDGDWCRQLVSPTYASSAFSLDAARYILGGSWLTTGAKLLFEIPVSGNWANLVLHHAQSTAEFKVSVEVL